jgi:hypothetical protein
MRCHRVSARASLVTVLAFFPFVFASVDASAQNFNIPQSVVGSGGMDASGTNYGVRGTVGQPGIGTTAGDSYQASLGYWYNPGTTVTAIDEGASTPRVFALDQNYPNPFNPSTTIRFSVPKSSHVTLAVYDIAGRLVTSLVDEEMAPGVHEAVFEAGDIASGVYFYRIRAGEYTQTRKLVLLK